MFSPRNTPVRGDRSSFNFTPQGSVKSVQNRTVASIFTPSRKQKSHLNRSVLSQSQVLEETSNVRIEKYGLQLPVLITEALTFADKSTRISVKVDESGWAWLVGGRKLFVWRYKQPSAGRTVLCKELTLPPSDLAHSAARVCVIPSNNDSQTASCIAVSPEGVVRYWSNVAYEASSMEISAELKGEECDSVVNLDPYGCLLATTTSSLVMISISQGMNSVSCHPLKATQGMFAGFGRRMSSLIFGGGQGQNMGAPLLAVIAGNLDDDERPFYVLSGIYMHKWLVGDFNMDKFLYQIDADRLFREALAKNVWDKDAIRMTQLTTWLLDMQLTPDGVAILGAGVDLEQSEPVVNYALATVATDVSGTPSKLEAFKVLNFTRKYQEDNELDALTYRLLISNDNVYMYNDFTIIMDSGTGMALEELPAPGGRLIGAGVCEGNAVFFSITQGLISVMPNIKQEVSILDDETQEMLSRGDMSKIGSNMAQIEELSMSEDKSQKLKAAFLSACSGKLGQAQDIVDELFGDITVTNGNTSTDIDQLVSALSFDLIDDFPVSDPRWAERAYSGSGSTSLIILKQLTDKQKAHEYIINFLKKVNLWDKLRTLKRGDHTICTKHLLSEHVEKLEAAIALREMHPEYSNVIDSAIQKVLHARGETLTGSLSPQDIFYRQVSGIDDIIECLLQYENDIMSGNFTPSDIISVILSVNSVIEAMLKAAISCRQSKASIYQTGGELIPVPEYIPWTSQSHSSGIRSLLQKQYMLTLKSGIQEVRDLDTRNQLFQHLLSFTDNILDGYTSQIASLAQNTDTTEYMMQVEDKYIQERHDLIAPFLEYEQYERAGSLAEKYCDFEVLIRICELTGNQERIQRYQQQFADKGFSDFLFSWYMKEGKQGTLLSLPTQQTKLNSFLQKDELGYLKWLNDIECKDFKSAHETLLNLGRNEEDFLAKRKTLLSLSKLCALANGDIDDDIRTNIRQIDEEQELILHQDLLPGEVLEEMGIDRDQMNVLSPVELIQLYICDKNSVATEYDFKKALDLMQFIDQEDSTVDLDIIKTSIWGTAIQRDISVWTHTTTGDPIDNVRDTIFFKTISLAVTSGSDPRLVLPSLESLLSSESLTPVSSNKQLQFYLGAVYEMVNTVMSG
ncbi:hypothetical protein ACF0H5_003428 [Mactra antiquata]